MRLLYFHMAIGFTLLSLKTFSQSESSFSTDKVLECIIESYADDLEDEADLSNMLNELEQYIESPLRINHATREDFEKLHILNNPQITSLLNYRDKMGQIFSLQELLTLDEFNEKLVDDLSGFITFNSPDTSPRKYLHNEINLRTQYTFEKSSGFKTDENGIKKFSGIEPKLYLKYRAEKDDKFDLGLTAENDAGEPFFSGPNRAGFDFYSGFVGWKGGEFVRKVYIGDFQIKMGQGLTLWSGFGGRKSSDATNIRHTGQGIRPYASSTEYGFFRGIAAQFSFKQFEIITFYSNKNEDANVTETDSDGNPNEVSSLQTTGYHRTESEISDKNSLNVQKTGLGIKYSKNNFSTGTNIGYQKYNIPLYPTEKLYNKYYFRGKENFNISADYLWAFNQVNFFGEASISKSGGTALVTGIEMNPSTELGVCILFRDYKKEFQPISSSSFSEFGTGSNERGIYTGITCHAINNMTINSYLDLYESHWVKYSSTKPVKGYDFILQSDYRINSNIKFYFRYKTEVRNENSPLASTIKLDALIHTNRIRLNIEWEPSENLRLRFRTEWSGIEDEESLSQGVLFLTDASISSNNDKFCITTRLSWFNTDNYDSRIYTYENDVPSSFYIPAFYSEGWRYYLNLRYKILKGFSIYFKLSQTKYSKDISSIGTGYLLIDGNTKTEFKFQLRFSF